MAFFSPRLAGASMQQNIEAKLMEAYEEQFAQERDDDEEVHEEGLTDDGLLSTEVVRAHAPISKSRTAGSTMTVEPRAPASQQARRWRVTVMARTLRGS